MSTTPLLYKENGGLMTTPQQQQRPLPPPHSAGRSFGTPLSHNKHSVLPSLSSTSKPQLQQRQSSSKKVVRARKLVQQYRSPPPAAAALATVQVTAVPTTLPPPPPPPPPSREYTVTFLPGPIGMQLEPANNGLFGCRVSSLVDPPGGCPGQARLNRQIQPGDTMVELNDEAVFHKEYDDIIARLREMSNQSRKILFRSNENTGEPATRTPRVSSVSFAENFELLTPVVVSPPNRDVVLEIEETPESSNNNNNNHSIDSSSTITPSKIKNLSQEDLELGLGQRRRLNLDHHYSKSDHQQQQPLGHVLRNVYHKLGEAFSSASQQQEMQDRFQKKSQLVQDLNHASSLVQQHSIVDTESEKALLEKQFRTTLDQLRITQSQEIARNNQLEHHLTEANARVAELTVLLREQQTELDRQVQEAQDKANAREYRLSQKYQMQQTDLESKLLEAKSTMETLLQQKDEAQLYLKSELQAAKANAQQLQIEKEQAQASLQDIQLKMEQLQKSTTASDKSTQYEAQVQVAKLQTELRDEKKQNEFLSDQLDKKCELLKTAEASLQETQNELEGTQCMIDKYEERFIEREKEIESFQEEKEFAGRELAFAQSEIQKLKTRLDEKDKTISDSKEETLRLEENLAMARKELDDQKQISYDKERELQAQLSQRTADADNLQKEMEQGNTASLEREQALQAALEKRVGDAENLQKEFEQSKIASLEREQALQTALDKRDADLAALNREIDTHVESLRQELQSKETSLQDVQTKLYATEEKLNLVNNEKEDLQKEVQELKDLTNETYFEKCRITKELQTVKVELSEAKIQHTKIQDTHLQRAKQMDNKAKEAQNALKERVGELTTANEKLERANAKITSLNDEIDRLEGLLESSATAEKALQNERDQLARREYQLQNEVEDKERERQSSLEASRSAKSQLFEATSRISQLERQISELEASGRIAGDEVSSLKEENYQLSRKVESISGELDGKESELSLKTLEILTLETTVENLREELQQRQEEVEASQKSLVAVQSQYTQLHERFVEAAEESSNKLQELTSDLIKAQDELAESHNTCTKLERQVGSLKFEMKDCESKLHDALSNLEEEKQKVAELASSNIIVKEDCGAKLAEMHLEIERCQNHVAILEQECSEKGNVNANLTLEISGLEKKLASSRSLFGTEQSKYKKDRKDLEDLLTKARQESSRDTERLNAVTADLNKAKEQLKDMEMSFQDQQSIMGNDMTTKEQKIGQLRRQKDDAETKLADCQEELNVAKLEIQRLEESRRRSREEVEHLSTMIDELREEHLSQIEDISNGHKEEVSRHAREKEDMESSIRKGEELRERLQSRLEETEKSLNDARDRNEELLMDQDALSSNLYRAEDLVAELRCELQVLRDEQANASFDSVDSQTLALSKRELRVKCKLLTDEIQVAETRAAEAKSGVTQRTQHIRSLEGDMAEMSAEMERMIQTSEQLESALLKARSDKATSDANASELRTSIELHQAKTQALKDELDQQYTENSALHDKVRALQQDHKTAMDRASAAELALEESREALQLLEEQHSEVEVDLHQKTQELLSTEGLRQQSEARVSDLEFEIAKLEDKLAITEQENTRIQSESKYTEERLKEQLRELNNQCASERSTCVDLQTEIDDLQLIVSSKESSESVLQEKLVKSREYAAKMENLREEAVTKLTEASRVLAAQKGIIKVQEARAADAESRAKTFAEQAAALQESVQELEEKSSQTGNLTQSQIEEMEKKRSLLEQARNDAKAEAETLRVEVRQANRKASDLEKVNRSLQSRMDELKSTAENTKAQLREARLAWSETDSLSRSLENELQNSQVQVEHLRAKLQLCGATIARLKSDRILLQENAVHQGTSLDPNSSSDVQQELSKVKAELHSKTAQLSSASASLRNYKKALKEMKQSEQQLVAFIDEIIIRADETFDQLSNLSSELQNSHLRHASTDNSSDGTPQKVMDDASCCINQFVSLVQQASQELEGKKRKLVSWKEQHAHLAKTPSAKVTSGHSLVSPTGPTMVASFNRLKQVISSRRDGNSDSSSSALLDCPQVEGVIMALEQQIDGLCTELTNAQAALKDKDRLYAELESSRQLSSIKEVDEVAPKERTQRAAVKAMAKVLENKSKADVNTALRKWSCEVASKRSSDKQKHNAEAIQYQLEETRKKLVLLKTHFKKRGNEKCLEILSD